MSPFARSIAVVSAALRCHGFAGAVSAQALDDKAAQAMMNKAGCAACHTLDKKGVGPAYRDVAKKYKGDAKAAETLAKKVRDGGVGNFGQVPMPPNPKDRISDADVAKMVAWILSK